MEETDLMRWSEVNRIIQSVPCSDSQLQRLADCAQIDAESHVLELADSLSLSAQCWVSMFGCSVEVSPVESFLSQKDDPSASSSLGGDPPEPGQEHSGRWSRHDSILWTLHVPLAVAGLEGAFQKIRASLNVNGCFILSLPVRMGLKPSAEVDAFYSEFGAGPMLPQEVVSSLEACGFEPLAVEFSPNRPALARYRMIESGLERCPSVDEATRSRWKREIKLFLKEGGTSFFPSAIFVARRWEYVDGS